MSRVMVYRQLATRRKKLGMTQADLARRAGVSRNYISLIERSGAQNVSVDIFDRLIGALGMTAEQDIDERAYSQGYRSAWAVMLRQSLEALGYNSDAAASRWALEREETVAALRRVCAAHGDNDWPEDLHLGDVIEKHLEKHLED